MTPEEEWMLYANMVIPVVATSSEEAMDNAQYSLDLYRNIELTRKAVTMGVALSALDGPLPVMDVVAFVGVSVYTTVLWSQFYLEYY